MSAVLAAGMNTPARPTLISSSGGSTCDQYAVSGVIRTRRSIATTDMAMPTTINGLGPILGSSCATTPAATMIPPLNGRNAKPAFNGL